LEVVMLAHQPLNILWIQTDEQRCDSLGCYGGRPVRTPHIDALAARGIRFNSHHVQSPVCVASRYQHQTGIQNNTVHYIWGRWPEGFISFPELFAQAGYVTCNLGKFHTPEHHTWLQNWHFEGFPHEAGHTTSDQALMRPNMRYCIWTEPATV
jgi:arylsulfatase A-like enzyme